MLCPGCGYYADKEESVCPECGAILNAAAELPTEGAEAIRQGKRARQAIRDAAAAQSTETRRRRRSGASHATVEMPAVRDDRTDEDPSVYPVSETEDADGEDGEGPVFERRRRSVYDENTALEEQERAYTEWIEKGGPRRLKMVNWMKVTIFAMIAMVLILAGAWLFRGRGTDEYR